MQTNSLPAKTPTVDSFKMLLAYVLILIAAIAGERLSKHVSHFEEWVPFFVIGLSLPITLLTYKMTFRGTDIHSRFKRIILWLMCNTPIAFLGYVIYHATLAQWRAEIPSVVKIGLFSLIACATLLTLALVNTENTFRQTKVLSRAKNNLIVLLFILISWCGLFQLPNWKSFVTSFEISPFLSTLAFLSCFSLITAFVFRDKSRTWMNVSDKAFFLFLIPLGCFILLSFRYDSLFVGSSLFHWGYFVGPIYTLKNGGWLLWDTPSQYGFLNLLTASLMPAQNAWQDFYLFQGCLLTIAACLIFKMITYNARGLLNLLVGFGLTISGLYFADPAMEGPYPFPSSSVARFFWCYVFLFLLFQYWKNENFSWKKLLTYGTLAWVPAVLWSAESAIYTTLTFYPALFTVLVQTFFTKNSSLSLFEKYKKTLLYLCLPVVILLAVMALISIYYRLVMGHTPDWLSFVIYGFSYAGGFGTYPLDNMGSVWILLLLLMGLATFTFSLVAANASKRAIVLLMGMLGCLWAIGSYFVGRAVPNNITAMLPILLTMSVLALHVASQIKMYYPTLILKITVIPLLFIVLITTIGNPLFILTLMQTKTFSPDVTLQMPMANRSLVTLLKDASVTPNDRTVYYGNVSQIRLFNNENSQTSQTTWLPIPLQLLEEPMPEARRQLVIKRFVRRAHDGGFLIHAKGEADDRFPSLLAALEIHFNRMQTFENKQWEIIRFEPK